VNIALAGAVLHACRSVLPSRRPLALHEPSVSGREHECVRECLESGWLSTAGGYVDRFEARLAGLTASKHVLATVNGTSALHLAAVASGVVGGDEVLMPALTFVATANAISYCGAIPHFVDVDDRTLGVDCTRLEAYLDRSASIRDGVTVNRESGRRVRALVLMHSFGHPADVDGALALARRWGLALIEDAAEAVGTTWRGRHAGTLGHVGALSFNGNKIVTTGGGGAVLTDQSETASAMRHLATTARAGSTPAIAHDRVGFNYRMPSLNAALGYAQIDRLPELLARKRMLASRYVRAFSGIEDARLFQPDAEAGSNHWLNTLILGSDDEALRDHVLAVLNADGIGARPVWTPMHRLPMYRECPRMDLTVTERLARSIINLPSGPALAPAASGVDHA